MSLARNSCEHYTPTVLLLSLPPSSLCGIDLLSFTTTPTFHGIKNIPPGWHFVFSAETTGLSLRSGFWFEVPHTAPSGQSSLFAYKWNAQSASLESVTDVETLRANLPGLWQRGLSPYRQSINSESQNNNNHDWSFITSRITPSILTHLTQSTSWGVSSASCAKEDLDDIPGLSNEEAQFGDRNLGTLGINLKKSWREGAIGRERTEAARDKSWALGRTILQWPPHDSKVPWGSNILGQMEACFIMILTIANYSCMEEWKRCIGLVLLSRSAIHEHQDFYISFLSLLSKQLDRCDDVEGGLFDFSDQGGALLKQYLGGFRSYILDANVERPLLAEMKLLETTLARVADWDMSAEYVRSGILELEDGEEVDMDMAGADDMDGEGEYAPVIVPVEDQYDHGLALPIRDNK